MFGDYQSAAYMAVAFRVPVPTLERTLQELGIDPACVLNETRYYDEDACDRLAEHFGSVQKVTVQMDA